MMTPDVRPWGRANPTPGGAGTPASPKTWVVHGLQARSFLGAAISGGPSGGAVVGLGPDPPGCPESDA